MCMLLFQCPIALSQSSGLCQAEIQSHGYNKVCIYNDFVNPVNFIITSFHCTLFWSVSPCWLWNHQIFYQKENHFLTLSDVTTVSWCFLTASLENSDEANKHMLSRARYLKIKQSQKCLNILIYTIVHFSLPWFPLDSLITFCIYYAHYLPEIWKHLSCSLTDCLVLCCMFNKDEMKWNNQNNFPPLSVCTTW